MKPTMRVLTAFILVAACSSELAAQNQATTYPARALTIVVPYPPGGGTDIIGRILGKTLSERWGQSVVVENQSGADGFVGTQRVLRAPADGYTMLLQVSQILLWKSSMPSAQVDILKDFRLVSKIQSTPLMFVVPSTIQVSTLKEFIAWCSAPAHACTWGSGTAHAQLVGKQFLGMAGIENAIHVPYKGTVPMTNDLIGGHISLAITSISSGMPHYKSGKLKFIGASARERSPVVPEVPTLAEMGYKVFAETWYGLLVAKATPQPVFEEIAAAVKAASNSQAMIAAVNGTGMTPIFSSPVEFAHDVAREIADLEPVLAKYPLGDRQ